MIVVITPSFIQRTRAAPTSWLRWAPLDHAGVKSYPEKISWKDITTKGELCARNGGRSLRLSLSADCATLTSSGRCWEWLANSQLLAGSSTLLARLKLAFTLRPSYTPLNPAV